MTVHAQGLVDPLAAFLDGAVETASRRPIPLVSTRFDVRLAAGLAVVSARRVFRNAEDHSIEATLTFPVPVHATVFELEARIGGRVLKGVAQAQRAARRTYEDAIDRGKPAVLHEEALRGVHVLSVAHIAPGEEVEVRCDHVETLRRAGDRLTLRIPTTVGQIYGRTPLSPADDLLVTDDAEPPMADLNIIASDDLVLLHGRPIEGGAARAPLSRPIDLSTGIAPPRALVGRFADGAAVTLNLTPAITADAALELAILVDRSGSMGAQCDAERDGTKHEAVVAGLRASARRLGVQDRVDLWQFDTGVQHLGVAEGAGLAGLLDQLSPPGGGTEIGGAIGAVARRSTARDILVITDGLSHALDVQRLAGSWRRISALLVGEDSLEATIGRLAALTGGEIFVAAARDLAATVETALAILRRAPGAAPTAGPGDELSASRAGLDVTARWGDAPTAPATEGLERAIGAFVAALRLPGVDEAAAARLAEAEGLVCHLTSLVLVDEAAGSREDLPELRKVALPRPALPALYAGLDAMFEAPERTVRYAAGPGSRADGELDFPRRRAAANGQTPSLDILSQWYGRVGPGRTSPSVAPDPTPGAQPPAADHRARAPEANASPARGPGARLAGAIRWAKWGHALARGDLGPLPAPVATEVRSLAASAPFREAAARLGLAPVLLVLAALATISDNPFAARVARRIMKGRDADLLSRASDLLTAAGES